MASRIFSPRLGFRGAQQMEMQIQCRLQPRRYLSLTSRLQLASKKKSTIKSAPSSSTPPPKASPSPKDFHKNTKPNSNSTSQIQTLDVLWKQRKVPLIFACALVFCMTVYTSLIITKLNKAGDCVHEEHAIPTGLPEDIVSAVDSHKDPEEIRKTAEDFDRDLNFPERVTGTRRLRKKLAARAKGHVLEVSIGTGRNLPFYDFTDLVREYLSSPEALAERQRKHMDRLMSASAARGKKVNSNPEQKQIGWLDGEILSFTGLDISPDMLGIARTRIREYIPGLDKLMHKRRREPMPRDIPQGQGAPVVDILDSKVRLFMGDAQSFLPPPPPAAPTSDGQVVQQKYDTILQTFGLCSVADPAKLLSNMASVIKPDTGRIILLEHGRGWSDWINTKLDQFALPHFQRYGCWWNRDIEGVVREAASRVPGLEVVQVERPFWTHFGTTLVIELRVRGEIGGSRGK
ncbi:hypothetical protein QBC37DRAFT_432458 [Rhypophila decipiens]|uniref:S-adenosyl-L-methionine-dependent methyltransferase n=1 Tax=Rhypophila decipiens TaxID=261697 RepID=A0AAN6XYL8_9PEZI|nr:hypothetical protein QBC37DRAFT_432458 [Rhypophila decipiens]